MPDSRLQIVARFHLEIWQVEDAAKLLVDLIVAKHEIQQPRDVVFGIDQLELGMPVENAAEDELVRQRGLHFVPHLVDALRRFRELIPRDRVNDGVLNPPGDDMNQHRHIEIFGRRPERIVAGVAQRRSAHRRDRVDQGRPQPLLASAFQFANRPFGLVQRDNRIADQSCRMGSAIFGDPVVVGARRRLHDVRVVDLHHRREQGWKQQFGIDPGTFPKGDPHLWIVARFDQYPRFVAFGSGHVSRQMPHHILTGVEVGTFDALIVIDGAWGPLTQFIADPLLP